MPKQTTSLIELIKRDSTVDIDYDCLTVSEIQHIISETPLTHENRKIATLRYVSHQHESLKPGLTAQRLHVVKYETLLKVTQ